MGRKFLQTCAVRAGCVAREDEPHAGLQTVKRGVGPTVADPDALHAQAVEVQAIAPFSGIGRGGNAVEVEATSADRRLDDIVQLLESRSLAAPSRSDPNASRFFGFNVVDHAPDDLVDVVGRTDRPVEV